LNKSNERAFLHFFQVLSHSVDTQASKKMLIRIIRGYYFYLSHLKASCLWTQHSSTSNSANFKAIHCASDVQGAILWPFGQLGKAHTATNNLGSILPSGQKHCCDYICCMGIPTANGACGRGANKEFGMPKFDHFVL
jgi:hypothetical protein